MSLLVCDSCGDYINKRYILVGTDNLNTFERKLDNTKINTLYEVKKIITDGINICAKCRNLCINLPEKCLTVIEKSGKREVTKTNPTQIFAQILKDTIYLKKVNTAIEKNARKPATKIKFPSVPT